MNSYSNTFYKISSPLDQFNIRDLSIKKSSYIFNRQFSHTNSFKIKEDRPKLTVETKPKLTGNEGLDKEKE
jgi:hypothetical protein